MIFQKSEIFSLIIKLNTELMIVEKVKTKELQLQIVNGIIEIMDNIDADTIVEKEYLTESSLKRYVLYENIITYILENNVDWDWLLNVHETAEKYKTISNKFNISVSSLRRILRKYIQGGLVMIVLAPQYNKCGGKGKTRTFRENAKRKGNCCKVRDEKMTSIFEKMTDRFLSVRCKISYKRLYDDMVSEFYSTGVIINGEKKKQAFPESFKPTKKQLVRWIHTHVDDELIKTLKDGEKEMRNNNRATFGDTISYLDVKTIGSRYEMDEMESDFYLVNRVDRNEVIGKAIVYFIVDVDSKAIVACSIGLENNSWCGAEIALLNMVEDKKSFCEKYGIVIKKENWPMEGAIPAEIIVDNGSEYLSKDFENLVRELGIGVSFLPTKMPSLKGNVEQKFNQMNLELKESLPGAVDKKLYNQQYISNAVLDIHQFSKCVIEFILKYNSDPRDDYPFDQELYATHMDLCPINIWNYKLQKYNELRFVKNINQFKYSLLKRDIANITRNGIEYDERTFICLDIEWLENKAIESGLREEKGKGKGKKDKDTKDDFKLEIRYDMRNEDIIYFRNDGTYYAAYLNTYDVISNISSKLPYQVGEKQKNEIYAHLSSPEIEVINRNKRIQLKRNEEIRLNSSINTNDHLDAIIDEADSLHYGKNNKKNIKENHKVEQEKLRKEDFVRIDGERPKSIPQNNILKEDKIDNNIDISKLSNIEILKLMEKNRIYN